MCSGEGLLCAVLCVCAVTAPNTYFAAFGFVYQTVYPCLLCLWDVL